MKLRAPMLLGWHAVRWLAGGAQFWRGTHARAEFEQNYEADGIRPLTAEERDAIPEWQACTACGLCDLACPEAKGPMLVVAGMQRDIPRHRHYRTAAVPVTECGSCDDCEQFCPVGVPIREVARFVVGTSSD